MTARQPRESEVREPLSTRVKPTTKTTLAREADRRGWTVGHTAAEVLDAWATKVENK